MMETPSARIIAAANATIIAQDSEGRTLELHRMTALDRLRLFKTVGAELAQNTPISAWPCWPLRFRQSTVFPFRRRRPKRNWKPWCIAWAITG
jgi:hypothetical protein